MDFLWKFSFLQTYPVFFSAPYFVHSWMNALCILPVLFLPDIYLQYSVILALIHFNCDYIQECVVLRNFSSSREFERNWKPKRSRSEDKFSDEWYLTKAIMYKTSIVAPFYIIYLVKHAYLRFLYLNPFFSIVIGNLNKFWNYYILLPIFLSSLFFMRFDVAFHHSSRLWLQSIAITFFSSNKDHNSL